MRLFCVLLLSLLCSRSGAEIVELSAEEQDYCYIRPGGRYEYKDRSLLPREGLFSYFSPPDQPLLPVIHSPGHAGQGNVCCALVALPEELDFLKLELLDEELVLRLRADGFALEHQGEMRLWSVLLGLPSDLPGGAYTLRLEGVRGGRRFQLLAPLEVREVSFGFEALELSRGLGALLTEDEERRLKEAARLHELLQSARPGALFHTGSFTGPLKESVPTAFFGDRREYVFAGGKKTASIHNGTDLASPAGTEVRTCGSGQVVLASSRLVSGNSVVIEHLPGVYSLYFHLQELNVREKDLVVQGQVLGTVGSTGLATGAHLHWELRVSGVAVNPEYYLGHPLIDKSVISGLNGEDF
jgi:hypothetical protein